MKLTPVQGALFAPEDIPTPPLPEPLPLLGGYQRSFLECVARLAPQKNDGIDQVQISFQGKTVTLTYETGQRARERLRADRLQRAGLL